MNRLRHDLLTSGWSMIDCRKWLDGFNRNWQETPSLAFRYWGLMPQVYRDFIGEMDWLLHEALFDETFRASYAIAISDWSNHFWHRDGGYLRVLFTPRGEGTSVARGFEDNVVTPHGYALIMTGTYRMARKQIGATYHTSPHSAYERRLFVADF
jgi:hypothetical protein